ncbi:MAG: 4Fe-4S binding protein [Christensenella sp.]
MSNNVFRQLFDGEPEQQNAPAEAVIRVNRHRCPENHPCPSVRVCPVQALSQIGYSAPTADMDKCIKCGKCVRYCPMGAITLG